MTPLPLDDIQARAEDKVGAILSECGRYRYWLRRDWDIRPPLLWVMLNPSTADAEVDDPTIRRCMSFARGFGFGGIEVVNLYALRATDPVELKRAADPVGPENDTYLRRAIKGARVAVAAWGAKAERLRASKFYGLCRAADADLRCLGMTKDGHPRHPLYMPNNSTLSPMVFAALEPRP